MWLKTLGTSVNYSLKYIHSLNWILVDFKKMFWGFFYTNYYYFRLSTPPLHTWPRPLLTPRPPSLEVPSTPRFGHGRSSRMGLCGRIRPPGSRSLTGPRRVGQWTALCQAGLWLDLFCLVVQVYYNDSLLQIPYPVQTYNLK